MDWAWRVPDADGDQTCGQAGQRTRNTGVEVQAERRSSRESRLGQAEQVEGESWAAAGRRPCGPVAVGSGWVWALHVHSLLVCQIPLPPASL